MNAEREKQNADGPEIPGPCDDEEDQETVNRPVSDARQGYNERSVQAETVFRLLLDAPPPDRDWYVTAALWGDGSASLQQVIPEEDPRFLVIPFGESSNIPQHDVGVVFLIGDGKTLMLTPKEAHALALRLLWAAHKAECLPVAQYHYAFRYEPETKGETGA